MEKAKSCSLAVVGFNQVQTDEITNIIEGSYLDLKIDLFYPVESRILFKVSIPVDIDIIILNPRGFKQSLQEIVSVIKSSSPLTEIVIINFDKNYDLAVQAVRVGIRDILNYPIREKEILDSLERSQSYRDLYQKSNLLSDILTLLNHFGDGKKFSIDHDLLMHVDNFLLTKMQASPSLVISLQGTARSGKDLTFRTTWNKSLYGKIYEKKDLAQILGHLDWNKLRDAKTSFIDLHYLEHLYYFIFLGDQDQAESVLCFKVLKEKISDHTNFIMETFARLVQNAYRQFHLTQTKNELNDLIYKDEVTDLFNTRKLKLDLDFCVKKYHKTKEEFSIVFIDIDHFKSVNDGHGHLVGSKLLVDVGSILKDTLRDGDYIYRYGGDEFVVIIPATVGEEAFQVGRRVLNRIKTHDFFSDKGEKLNISVSVGIAEFPRDASSKDEVLQIADEMMYEAKKSGRGQVVSTREVLKGA